MSATAKKTQPHDAFLNARRALLLDHGFFGNLIMHLEPVADAQAAKGMWVDGVRIGYNPETFDDLDLIERAGLIAKGTLHCVLGHHLRRGDRDKETWQEACDYVTNPHIELSGLKLPLGSIKDRQYFDQGLSAEQVYVILEKKKNPNGGGVGGAGAATGQGQGQGSGQDQGGGKPTGEVRDLPGAEAGAANSAEKSHQEQEWKINAQQALNNSRSRGDMPANLELAVEKVKERPVDWKAYTRNFFQVIARNNASWSKPNRRFISQGLYLPTLQGTRLGTIVVAIDTSGSIGKKTLSEFGAWVNSIFEECQPEKVILIYCDAAIQSIEEFLPQDMPIELMAKGGGGTKFEPVFEYANSLPDVPAGLVYLTDMFGSFPDTEPEYPVLWASIGGQEAPFGDLVFIDESTF